MSSSLINIVVLISGNGTNLQAIIDAIHSKIINAKITCVISNKENVYGLTRAQKNNISTDVCLFNQNEISRKKYDTSLANVILNMNKVPDLIVLAGWMHIFTNEFLKHFPNIINLHPALPGKIPGKGAIEKAFQLYQQGKIEYTGVMVHHVIPQVDEGKVIYYQKIPIYQADTLQLLKNRIQLLEKEVLITGIIMVLKEIRENKRNKKTNTRLGKVREIIDIGYNTLALAASDRQSAFDRFICDINGKGKILNYASQWWFEKTKHIIPNHYLYSYDNVMIVKKCHVIPLEIVVRGYITGNTKTSLWTHYNKGIRKYCGIEFPDGLIKNQKLDTPVLTPTTKGIVDIPISEKEILEQKIVTRDDWNYISTKAIELFTFGQKIADKNGLILVDTKYEFGRDKDGNIILIDEVHTCDSSRYWMKESYKQRFENNMEPEKLDKDAIRDYVRSKCDPYKDKIPVIPDELIQRVLSAYLRFYNMITNKDINITHNYLNKESIIKKYFQDYHSPRVVILAGSEKDDTFVGKIKNGLKKNNIYHEHFVASAHKQPSLVSNIIEKYNNKHIKMIYVAVAGRSNALGGVLGANSKYPVISCPPFKDKIDMMVNLQSSLQCPSNVPVATILDTGNLVSFINKMFTML